METSKAKITTIFNLPAIKVQIVARKLASFRSSVVDPKLLTWIGEHSGAFVTTEFNGSFLIHKGQDYAGTPQGNQTVVVRMDMLSNAWRVVSAAFDPQCTIGKIVESMGSEYLLFGANCNDAVASIPFSTVRSVWNHVVPKEEHETKDGTLYVKSDIDGNDAMMAKLFSILVQPVKSFQVFMKNNWPAASLIKTETDQEIFLRHDTYKNDAQMLLLENNDQTKIPYLKLRKINVSKGIPDTFIVGDMLLYCGDPFKCFPTFVKE